MTKDYPGEQWKTVKFDFKFTNEFKIEVSNFGRIRTFNKVSNGNILKGSMINGYRIIRLKLYHPREEKIQQRLDYLQQQIFKLARKLKSQIANKENKEVIAGTASLLIVMKKNLSKKFAEDLKKRTIHYHHLVHRLVADYFLNPPRPDQTIVGHLDFNKLNNRANNLVWMAPADNYEHQRNSPFVIKDKLERRSSTRDNSKATKLSVTKVMLLKKLLTNGKPLKQLVKQFKVTDTQILRIKKGGNWGDIEAAK